MSRLIIVSNRLPVKLVEQDGELNFKNSEGGLATGLGSFYKSYDSKWIGWAGIPDEELKDQKEIIKQKLEKEKCYPVFLSQNDIDNYYYGFSNKTLWPLFHYFTQYTVYDKKLWTSYRKVNEKFMNVILNMAKPDDTIWIQDYHLCLLPRLLRDRMPELSIGYFLHIPFPSFEVFRLLPWRDEILKGILGSDLIGFHTYDYVRCFLEASQELLGYEHNLNRLIVDKNRIIKVDVFPMGIDFDKFHKTSQKSNVKKITQKIKKEVNNRKLILSVDRLDYSKGIIKRLEAFDKFLERNPDYKEKVTFAFVIVPSRTQVEHYEMLKRELDETAGRINGKYASIGWSPIWYMYKSFPFDELVAMYNATDIAFVTPIRDGMNLVAKEVVSAKADNKLVLILSEMAGASKELGEAMLVNPNDEESLINSLEKAMTIPEKTQIKNTKIMKNRLERYNVARWASDFIENLNQTKKEQNTFWEKKLIKDVETKMIEDFKKSKKRLILLDYDGTLVSYERKFGEPMLDDEVFNLLNSLSRQEETSLVILSGRDKETMEKAYGKLHIGMVSEHGVWMKNNSREWNMIEKIDNDWKDEIRAIFELVVDRTPGSLILEKEYAIAWYYHKLRDQLGLIRARELKSELIHYTINSNLEVIEGYKMLEIKDYRVNKGKALSEWLSKDQWDFILAIGDDWSDESMFEILPENSYSIKVGSKPSKAKFYIDSPEDVRALLGKLGG